MRLEKTATLTEILAQGRLGSLQERSSLIARLDTLLGFYLDQRLRQLVQVAAYQDGNLILTCTNATVASQLRYLSRIYIQQLRQHGEFRELARIKAVVAPAETTRRRPAAAPRRLSAATADLLRSLSDDLGSGEVSEALQRLARHGETADGANPHRSSRTGEAPASS